MRAVKQHPTSDDWVWQAIRDEAALEADREPVLASFLHSIILNHASLEEALSYLLAGKLTNLNLPSITLRDIMMEALIDERQIGQAVRADICAVRDRDPACSFYSAPLLYIRGCTRSKPIVYRTGCGSRTGRPWPSACRIGFRKSSAWTFTPRPGLVREFLLTMAAVSSLGRLPWLRIMCQCSRK